MIGIGWIERKRSCWQIKMDPGVRRDDELPEVR